MNRERAREMTHTPGPWLAEKAGDDYRIVYGEGNWLAEVYSDGWSDELASADAHLIAAAPDLLEVAKRILDRGYVSESIEEERVDHLAIVAAIAKAEGRS